MFWVYILRCSDGSYYTGHTDNIERRMAQYQVGECSGYTSASSSRAYRVTRTVTREEALSAEQQHKAGAVKRKKP
jgi:putative endonuclease